jgi:hypothetical protein
MDKTKVIKNLPVKNIPAKAPLDPTSLVKGLLEMANVAKDYLNTRETEITKREEIRHNADVQIEKIRSQKEVFFKFIEVEYAERSKVYENLFEELDKGIEKGNDKLIEGALSAIITQIKTNPIENFRKNFENPDHKDEV